jgi:hypothetical protein
MESQLRGFAGRQPVLHCFISKSCNLSKLEIEFKSGSM